MKDSLLQSYFNAILELKEHPDAKYCIGYVDDFFKALLNEDILKECSITWDDTNKGYTLVWNDVLPKYLFKADLLICKDYYQYNFVIRDREGNYLGSDGVYDQIYSWPFWRDIVGHLEEVYK